VKLPKRFVSLSTSIIGSAIKTNQENRNSGGTRCPQRVVTVPSHRLGDKPIHLLVMGFSPHFTFGK
jgi:hypothetical protein